jgi:O-antigen biosynthesis protein WbqP
MYAGGPKRLFDVLWAVASLIVLGPLMLVVAAIIRLQDGGPALIRQTRIGQGGRPFTLYKFRSMPVDTPAVASTEARALAITPFGRLIRRANIDELPQLFNVLRGDMSIVGPRPPLPTQEKLLAYRRENGAIHARPGLTGLAQVRSYDGMPVIEKALLDAEYARRITLGRDLAIVARTFRYLLRKPPVY